MVLKMSHDLSCSHLSTPLQCMCAPVLSNTCVHTCQDMLHYKCRGCYPTFQLLINVNYRALQCCTHTVPCIYSGVPMHLQWCSNAPTVVFQYAYKGVPIRTLSDTIPLDISGDGDTIPITLASIESSCSRS